MRNSEKGFKRMLFDRLGGKSLDLHKEISCFLLSEKSSLDWDRLFINCFLRTYLLFATKERSFAFYPGSGSVYGKFQDGIEGFYRILLPMATWLASGRRNPVVIRGIKDRSINIEDIVFEGIRNATDPSSVCYYGAIEDFDGRIIAASVIALSLWYLRNSLWRRFSPEEQERIGEWLNGVNGRRISDNNWHLYIVLTNAVLKSLGLHYSKQEYQKHYMRFKSFYRGEGWYSDGPNGIYDFYNAWVIHP